MARTIRDSNLDTRSARARLKARRKPYYRSIEPGLHLGYRKPKSGSGKWVMRHYVTEKKYQIKNIATADDHSDADGVAILSFREAQTKVRELMVSRAHLAAGRAGKFTVADAMDEYLDFLETNRKSAYEAVCKDGAFIRPLLGDLEVSALTTDKLRKWHSDFAKSAARLRTRPGEPQKFREIGDDDEWKRRRKSSANRTLTILKAALNRAWRDGKVASDAAWRRVEPFKDVDAARTRYLQLDEAKRLINACDEDFRKLVQAALMTGARYGELIALAVSDFNPDSGTVAIRTSKSGKPRHIVLTDEGILFFKQNCTGRGGTETLFHKSDGEPWRQSHQARPLSRANKAAQIKPAINFHGLRHTWASLSIMRNMPLIVVARNLGHSTTRMVEKHYGHLAPSFVADSIRANAPQFGFKPDRKVVGL